MANRVYHIIPYEKFTFDYITQINRCFNQDNHIFCIHGRKPDISIKKLEDFDNIRLFERVGWKEAGEIIRETRKYDKIIIHSLFMNPILFIAISMNIKSLSDKVFWNIWGADLYDAYWGRDSNLFHKIREVFRRRFISHVRAVGYIPSDYENLKKWYKTNAHFFLASYSYDFVDIPERAKKREKNILIGNSATRSCQHKEAIDLIQSLGVKDCKVWCVLSYPNDRIYIDQVVQYGRNAFGDNFIPLVDYMPYSQYMEILSSIDIAIFNNSRQQALGNIAALLFYGKRVFINPDNGCLNYFKDMGAEVYSTSELTSNNVDESRPEIKKKNQEVIQTFFSDEKFAERWNSIFESIY